MSSEFVDGHVVGERYVVEEVIARGGMGTVHRARDMLDGRLVALKSIALPKEKADAVAIFEREAALLERMKHPRIVRYLGRGKLDAERAYLVMEWMDGEELRSLVSRGPLALTDTLQLISCAAEALAAVHEEGIVHRDVKPANLFLRHGSPADVVLLDFGIARDTQGTSRITAAGMVVGTPQYMAPEQLLEGAKVGPSTDIFALGCVLYECLTGISPFDAPHVVGVITRILHDTPTPARSIRPSLPPAWEELLSRMLSRDPELRPKDGAALLALLGEFPLVEDDGRELVEQRVASKRPSFVEKKLVSVVVVAPPSVSSSDTNQVIARSASLSNVRKLLARVGFVVEELMDGSVVAMVSSEMVATDLARIGARGALHLRDAFPDARIAVATGRGVLGQPPHLTEAVGQAARLLENNWHVSDVSGVWVDSVTAGLLDKRFRLSEFAGATILMGEGQESPSSLLLGKPTPFVGRELELAELEALARCALDDGEPQGVLVLGAAGAGKSRLSSELGLWFRATYPEGVLLLGHCNPLMARSPYCVLRDALRGYAGVLDGGNPIETQAWVLDRLCALVPEESRRTCAEFLGELCGVSPADGGSPPLWAARGDPQVMEEHITQAFLEWISALCAEKPVMMVLEDLHWADALSLKLVRSVLRRIGPQPLFVLALGRPEERDAFSTILSSKVNEMVLRPLGRRAIEKLAYGALGEGVTPATLGRIVKLSDGNALFAEELIRAASLDKTTESPETLVAILQSRLSRLSTTERRVLRAASVIGETFWVGAVERVCAAWGASEDVAGWLERLVQEELVEPHQQSRFPGDKEMGFRHVLVRDAAYGLLTEVDRQSGHVAAGEWLESAGEVDAMVLAAHARAGREMKRAAGFFVKAAADSLGRNDSKEALLRAEKGKECWVHGTFRGQLSAIESLAQFRMADFSASAKSGLSALELLDEGSIWWCRTAERLVNSLPQIGDMANFGRLTKIIYRVDPEPDAVPAILCAVANLHYWDVVLLGHDSSGEGIVAIERLLGRSEAVEPRSRGIALLWRGIALASTAPALGRAQHCLAQAIENLELGHVNHELCMAYGGDSLCWRAIGDFGAAEASARRALVLAKRIEDKYQITTASLVLANALLERGDVIALEEAEALAKGVVDEQLGGIFSGSAWRVLGDVALLRGEHEVALLAQRKATDSVGERAGLYTLHYVASLLQALLLCDHRDEAFALAKRRLDWAKRWKERGPFEVPFGLAVAEAFYAVGEHEAADKALREARLQMERRASLIGDVVQKQRYLAKRENVRLLSLARRRL